MNIAKEYFKKEWGNKEFKHSYPEEKDLALSLIESITDSDITKIMPDLAEAALDRILDDGIVKDISVVQTVVALYKTIMSVRERLLIKKILLFSPRSPYPRLTRELNLRKRSTLIKSSSVA